MEVSSLLKLDYVGVACRDSMKESNVLFKIIISNLTCTV